MVQAYLQLHQSGFAHSVEAWIHGRLVGGLYCVSLGQAVFGESMFSLQPNGSKLALAALIAFCKSHHVKWVDCQQKTSHLASLGAREINRQDFLAHLKIAKTLAPLRWEFLPIYWHQLSNKSF
jgi:leucyl/phenylalanyl-tRNA--protein transferase